MYVLDTNTLIYFFKGMGRVAQRMLSQSPSDIGVPAIVLYELETGIAKSTSPGKRSRQLERLMDSVQVLAFSVAEAKASAEIRAQLEHKGTPIGPNDVLIAGTALACRGILVSHNLSEFNRIDGLETVDWY